MSVLIFLCVTLAFGIVGAGFGSALIGAVIGGVLGYSIAFGECEGPVYKFFFAPRPQADDVPVLTEKV